MTTANADRKQIWNDKLAIKVHIAAMGIRETLRKAVQLTDNPTADTFINLVDGLPSYVKGNPKEMDA